MYQIVPHGWPKEVQPPGSEGWEATATAWLLDLLPEYRQYKMMCRHPVILAFTARHVTSGTVDGARQGYRTVRTELAEHAPPHAVDDALKAYRTEGFRLAKTVQAVTLVERALRGERFLSGPRRDRLRVIPLGPPRVIGRRGALSLDKGKVGVLAKIRVYQLARGLGVESRVLISELGGLK